MQKILNFSSSNNTLLQCEESPPPLLQADQSSDSLATSEPPPTSLTPIQDTTSPAIDGAKNSLFSLSLPNLHVQKSVFKTIVVDILFVNFLQTYFKQQRMLRAQYFITIKGTCTIPQKPVQQSHQIVLCAVMVSGMGEMITNQILKNEYLASAGVDMSV